MSFVSHALVQLKGENFYNFVETGVEFGQGLKSAKLSKKFKNLYSCDLKLEYVNSCKKEFPEATILQSDSLSFLEDILPELSGITFFWLDAHYPKHYKVLKDDSDIKVRFPGLYEIQLIKKHKSGYENDWIALDDVMALNDEANPINRSELLDEYYRVNEYKYTDLLDTLKDTHIANGVIPETDILLFKPKTTLSRKSL